MTYIKVDSDTFDEIGSIRRLKVTRLKGEIDLLESEILEKKGQKVVISDGITKAERRVLENHNLALNDDINTSRQTINANQALIDELKAV